MSRKPGKSARLPCLNGGNRCSDELPVPRHSPDGFINQQDLVAEDRLAIVLTGVTGAGRAWLNDQLLGEFVAKKEAIRLSMTLSQLQQRNRLRIELSCSVGEGPGGLYDAVAMEIESDGA